MPASSPRKAVIATSSDYPPWAACPAAARALPEGVDWLLTALFLPSDRMVEEGLAKLEQGGRGHAPGKQFAAQIAIVGLCDLKRYSEAEPLLGLLPAEHTEGLRRRVLAGLGRRAEACLLLSADEFRRWVEQDAFPAGLEEIGACPELEAQLDQHRSGVLCAIERVGCVPKSATLSEYVLAAIHVLASTEIQSYHGAITRPPFEQGAGRPLACSFCRCQNHPSSRFIAGADAYICDSCLVDCVASVVDAGFSDYANVEIRGARALGRASAERCSYCHKPRVDARHLVPGPGAIAICDGCVWAYVELVYGHAAFSKFQVAERVPRLPVHRARL